MPDTFGPTVICKVSCYVLRDGPHGRELLVFAHPTAGVQVPAGSVEPREAPESAALREVSEETGLTDLSALSLLKTEVSDPTGDRRVLLEAVKLSRRPQQTAPFDAESVEIGRGWKVRELGREGRLAHVVYEDYKYSNGKLILKDEYTGWVPVSALAEKVVRYHYKITFNGVSSESWQCKSDHDFVFQVYWLPLAPKPELVNGQQEWLDSVYHQL